jgi:hypothetical protein
MQNSRTIALKSILEWVVVVGFRRSSLRGKLAVSGKLTIKYVIEILKTIVHPYLAKLHKYLGYNFYCSL